MVMAQKIGPDWVFLFYADHYWGTGNSEREARLAAVKAGMPRDRRDFNIYIVPAGAWVNAMGDIEWADVDANRGKHAIFIRRVRKGSDTPF